MKLLLTLLAPLLLLQSAFAGPALDSLPARAPAEEPTIPAPPQLPEWTVMIYMNGKSNIEPFALRDLNRLEAYGSNPKINIVAELGRSKGLDNDTAEDGDWAGVRRYLVQKDADSSRIASPVLADLGDVDMGDWKEAAAFLKWAKQAYPAKKYLFILWDHGWGWIDPLKPYGKPTAAAQKSISHDFTTGNYISTLELSKVFKEGGKVDLYVSMACFMQMAEVAYELKDAAGIIVGSEEVIQLPSLNFEGVLDFMNAKPKSGPEKVAESFVDTFREMYARPELQDMLNQAKYGVQLSAIRASQLPDLAQKLKAWHKLAAAPEFAPALVKAKADVLRFEVGDETTDPDKRISFYGDLWNFVELTGRYADPALPGTAALVAAGEDLKDHVGQHLVLHNSWLGKDRTGKTYENTHGLGINIPGKAGTLIEYYPTYKDLAFTKASDWETFMKYLQTLPD